MTLTHTRKNKFLNFKDYLNYSEGVIEDDVYLNEYVGIKVVPKDDFHFYNKEELEQREAFSDEVIDKYGESDVRWYLTNISSKSGSKEFILSDGHETLQLEVTRTCDFSRHDNLMGEVYQKMDRELFTKWAPMYNNAGYELKIDAKGVVFLGEITNSLIVMAKSYDKGSDWTYTREVGFIKGGYLYTFLASSDSLDGTKRLLDMIKKIDE